MKLMQVTIIGIDRILYGCLGGGWAVSESKRNLIYDIGLHKGEDTDFYLKKGYDVIAFEANPSLIAYCRKRFEDAVASGRLQIIEGAIAPESAGERIPFYVNPDISGWGTIAPEWVERNAKLGHNSHKIEVPRIDLVGICRSYGIPYYAKIDIEGADMLVLESFKQFTDRPNYVSIEADKVQLSELNRQMTALRDLVDRI
jgi:FkbM family methyltransferase